MLLHFDSEITDDGIKIHGVLRLQYENQSKAIPNLAKRVLLFLCNKY